MPQLDQQSPEPIKKRNVGGRPKGRLNARTIMLRKVRDNAIVKGKTPLDTMLKNMRRFDDEAEGMYNNLREMVESGRPPKSASADVHMAYFDKVMELLSKMRECRLDAQKCAVDAAPFVHPRLTTVEYKNTTDTIKAKPEVEMSEDEMIDYYNKLRERPLSVAPLVIDNETGEQVHEEVE